MDVSKMFTIQKQKCLDKTITQTEKDFENIKSTLHREKSFYLPQKQEVILKEQNEIYKIYDHSLIQEDTKKYLLNASKQDAFESKKLNSYLSKKFY